MVVNLYQDKKFKVENIDYQLLFNLLNGESHTIEMVNVTRCELKTKLLLPADSRVPSKSNLEEEKLTKQQLFQYDDNTIATAEQ